ncbi:MAG: hypothetical protein EXS46_02575 [Candidatus Taylorbacteria bacterium]|nr:hypothetical protein [Candidatus Taylorbacteria bacterium]
MSIRDWWKKIKGVQQYREKLTLSGISTSRYYISAIIVLVGLSSFGLGRLSSIEDGRRPITIEETNQISKISEPTTEENISATQAKETNQNSSGGKLIASRNGTKYYLPWCSSNIAEKNKIWFNSEVEAKAKGYEPATNCKGLK